MLLGIVLTVLFSLLIVPTSVYYLWMRKKAGEDWNMATNPNYRPEVTLIIATFNEAHVMERKLANVQEMVYPRDNLQVIIVDSNSNDGTLDVCRSFMEKNSLRYPVKLISEEKRMGKSHALNTALGYANGEIIATSDADAFWEPDALQNAVVFLSDHSVGAVTGHEVFVNLEKNIYTRSEGVYRDFYHTLRVGESKTDSLLTFDASLGLFKRSILGRFEDRPGLPDDLGTALNIISKGYRCILVPQAVFHDATAYSLSGRLRLKSRRAQHLIAGVVQALKLKIRKKIALSPAIVAFNFYMYVICPIFFFPAIIASIITLYVYFPILWFLIPLFFALLVFHKPRIFFVSYLTSQLALVIGLLQNILGKKEATWRKIEEM